VADRPARGAEPRDGLISPQAERRRADYRSTTTVPFRLEVAQLPVYTAPTAAYKQQSILTATPGQLVVMLYDGCLRFLHQAAHAMRDGNLAEAGTRLSRAEAIVDELLSTLDMEKGGVIASRLQGIYVFSVRHLMEARLERDADKIEKVSQLLSELRDSWVHVAATA
jgi:flagellar secretion chaperone FliS